MHFLDRKVWYFVSDQLKFVPKGPVDNKSGLASIIQVMAWDCRQQAIVWTNDDQVRWYIYVLAELLSSVRPYLPWTHFSLLTFDHNQHDLMHWSLSNSSVITYNVYMVCYARYHIHGLIQKRCNYIANALDFCLCFIKWWSTLDIETRTNSVIRCITSWFYSKRYAKILYNDFMILF